MPLLTTASTSSSPFLGAARRDAGAAWLLLPPKRLLTPSKKPSTAAELAALLRSGLTRSAASERLDAAGCCELESPNRLLTPSKKPSTAAELAALFRRGLRRVVATERCPKLRRLVFLLGMLATAALRRHEEGYARGAVDVVAEGLVSRGLASDRANDAREEVENLLGRGASDGALRELTRAHHLGELGLNLVKLRLGEVGRALDGGDELLGGRVLDLAARGRLLAVRGRRAAGELADLAEEGGQGRARRDVLDERLDERRRSTLRVLSDVTGDCTADSTAKGPMSGVKGAKAGQTLTGPGQRETGQPRQGPQRGSSWRNAF
jgi:hypothetical protein